MKRVTHKLLKEQGSTVKTVIEWLSQFNQDKIVRFHTSFDGCDMVLLSIYDGDDKRYVEVDIGPPDKNL